MSKLLDAPVFDDLDVGVTPEEYRDQASPAPPAAGNYNFRLLKFGFRKDEDGNLVLREDRWPVFVIEQVEIVEPEEAARKVSLYQDISTKPFERDGFPGATQIGDLIRAIDQSRGWRGVSEAEDILLETVASSGTFRGRIDWTAYDSEYAKSTLEAIGLSGKRYKDMTDEEQAEANKVYNKAKLNGMKRFPKLPNGKHSHVWEGPSGEKVEARPKVTRWYPSEETVRLG